MNANITIEFLMFIFYFY